MSEVKVVPLDVNRDVDERIVGPKAASLFRMMRIGLPVPAGFCITETAFREHLQANKLTAQIESALDELAKTKPGTDRSILSELRQAIINAPLADTIRDDIENHCRTLAAGRLAVRSSATVEDLPGHSFAGQYETYLGVADIAGCIDAIKKCWASLWTERAYEYRQKNSFDHLKVSMAVIVQSLIHADAAGVIFTTDPVTGSSSRIIIEACFGLGDSLVSGKVTPDRFIIRKRNLKIISRRIQNRKIEFVFDKTGSMKKNADEKNKMCGPCINNKIAKELAKLARKTESKFGRPQDIEWAVRGNKIFFLQSRPITAVAKKKSWEDRQVWTNANTGEVLPDVVTPITWSLIQTLLVEIFERAIGLIGVNLSRNPLFGLIAGRIYFNINTSIAALNVFSAPLNPDINKFFGGEHEKKFSLGQIDIPDEDIPKLRINLAKFILKIPGLIFRILTCTPKKGDRMIAEFKNQVDRLQSLDINIMDEEQLAKRLIDEIADFRNALTDTRYGVIYTVIGLAAGVFAALLALNKVCTKWLNDTDGIIANNLLAGVGEMDSAEAGFELWRLAQKAHDIKEIEKIITAGDNWDATSEKLSMFAEGEQFLRNWGEFMTRHGHHCRGEAELFNPRWSDCPDYILGSVRTYISSIGRNDPLGNYARRSQQREQLTKQCRQQLKNPLKRLVFNFVLNHVQRFAAIRENLKSLLVQGARQCRKMLVELGKNLNSRGTLESADDVFFLRFEELGPVTQNKADFDVRQIIASRRAEYEKNQLVTPPKVVIGKFDPDNFTPEAVDADVQALNGLAVSSGVVTGKARVILETDTNEQVLPGEILVAPFTDPGWTPYFVPAAAIVVDMGGLLSHGSIIAREYGIPAVVNVGPATKIVKTGQTIQVDGNRGVVTILKTLTSANNQST